jgi:hypothetical protein
MAPGKGGPAACWVFGCQSIDQGFVLPTGHSQHRTQTCNPPDGAGTIQSVAPRQILHSDRHPRQNP